MKKYRCPICRDRSAVDQLWKAANRELIVQHDDGTVCKRQPCDARGRI